MTFTKNIKDAFDASSDEQDRGSLVETVLLIAGFAVVAILVVTWIGNAIAGQAADISECITGANSYSSGAAAETETECSTNDRSDAAQDANEATGGWEDRFGSSES